MVLLGLWSLTPLTTILLVKYRDRQFYRWRQPEYTKKTTDPLSQVTDKHNVVSITPGYEQDLNSQH